MEKFSLFPQSWKELFQLLGGLMAMGVCFYIFIALLSVAQVAMGEEITYNVFWHWWVKFLPGIGG
jgi:hypothetical protein